jgi:hypothetical protein
MQVRYSSKSLPSSGTAEIFLSPKMSESDAPEQLAKDEHLFEEDSIRVSYAVRDAYGEVVARRLESLLVSDIPLDAWVAMLKDSRNIFGGAFELKDEGSALSIMELFRDLRLPEALIPEGPVTIVEAVLPYIQDPEQWASVQKQLGKYRVDQELYRKQAEQKAGEWMEFELELARSLYIGRDTFTIRAFIASLQHQWGHEDLQVILEHDHDGKYVMTPRLAAVLERAKQNLIGGEAALATGNEKVLSQLDGKTAEKIIEEIRFIETIRGTASLEEIRARQTALQRNIAKRNLRIGGGCAGDRESNFNGDDSPDGADVSETTSGEDSTDWTWKKGVCRVEACKSPKPTEVGPCHVCRNCQHMFDKGIDPTKASFVATKMIAGTMKQPEWFMNIFRPAKNTRTKTDKNKKGLAKNSLRQEEFELAI